MFKLLANIPCMKKKILQLQVTAGEIVIWKKRQNETTTTKRKTNKKPYVVSCLYLIKAWTFW